MVYIFLIFASFASGYKDIHYYHYLVLWDINTLTCQYSKTTGPILMKLIGYDEHTHRGLYTNFQSNSKFCIKVRIFSFKGYGCFLWSCMYAQNLKELSNLFI